MCPLMFNNVYTYMYTFSFGCRFEYIWWNVVCFDWCAKLRISHESSETMPSLRLAERWRMSYIKKMYSFIVGLSYYGVKITRKFCGNASMLGFCLLLYCRHVLSHLLPWLPIAIILHMAFGALWSCRKKKVKLFLFCFVSTDGSVNCS